MDQRIIDLYDNYTHGHISRRVFMSRATKLTGSAGAAAGLLPLLQSNYAMAETVPANDARLTSEEVTFDAPKGKGLGYLSRPKAQGKRPAILVIPQNRGLNPHIKDVTRRYAMEGYLALGVDSLSTVGGTPTTDAEAAAAHGRVPREDFLPLMLASIAYLKGHAESNGKIGVVGFCFGGGMVNQVAMSSADIAAAVSYYGPIPQDKSKVKDIAAPLLLHYAGNDANVNPGIPSWEEALKAAGKPYTLHMYPDVQHAFSDDTAGPRYNKAAADLAWTRTQAFFRQHVGAPPNAG